MEHPDYQPIEPYKVSPICHQHTKGIEYAIKSAALAIQLDTPVPITGDSLEEIERNLKHQLLLHLFTGESLIDQ